MSLLVEFITGNTKVSKDDIMRNHGDAAMVSECESSSLIKDERRLFITVLTPHKRDENSKELTGRVEIIKKDEDLGYLCLKYIGKAESLLSYKLDLSLGIHPYTEDRAPAYDWGTGKLEYGDLVTDADFSYIGINDKSVDYGMFNGSRIYYCGKDIFSAPRYTTRDFLVEKFKEIDHKWRAWSGNTEL